MIQIDPFLKTNIVLVFFFFWKIKVQLTKLLNVCINANPRDLMLFFFVCRFVFVRDCYLASVGL